MANNKKELIEELKLWESYLENVRIIILLLLLIFLEYSYYIAFDVTVKYVVETRNKLMLNLITKPLLCPLYYCSNTVTLSAV